MSWLAHCLRNLARTAGGAADSTTDGRANLRWMCECSELVASVMNVEDQDMAIWSQMSK